MSVAIRGLRGLVPALAFSAALLGATAPPAHDEAPHRPDTPTCGRLARLPLAFERNDGQTDASVRFVARDRGCTLFVRPADAVMAFPDAAVAMRLVGARPDATTVALDELPGRANHFVGNDPAKWHTEIPTYRRVECRRVWPGIDVAYHGSGGRLEYDFVVAPDADPDAIALEFDGADAVDVDPATGDLVVRVGSGELRQERPTVWEEVADGRRPLAGEFRLLGDRRVGFHVAGRDASRTLVIDPPIAYATYLGGFGFERATGVAVDADGATYVCGGTMSATFPVVLGVASATPGPNQEVAFASKLNATGSCLLWSTFLGGTGGDAAEGIAIDTDGNAYLCGSTASSDFPTTEFAFDRVESDGVTLGAGDGFVAKIDARGSALVYSTYLGGRGIDAARGIAVDSARRAIVVGVTDSELPAAYHPAPGGVQATYGGGAGDAFVMWLSPSGDALESATYVGGADHDFGTGVAVDSSDEVVVVGGAWSPSLLGGATPIRPHSGAFDLFAAKFADGNRLRWVTYLGGSGSEPGYFASVDLDAQGDVFIGTTTTSGDFPGTAATFDSSYGGGSVYGTDAVVARLDRDGVLAWAAYVGGVGDEYPVSLAVDHETGTVILAGGTDSRDFPVAGPASTPYQGGTDGFLVELEPSGPARILSTCFGGYRTEWCSAVRAGPLGSIHLVGNSNSPSLRTPGAYHGMTPAPPDVFVNVLAPGGAIRTRSISIVPRRGRLFASGRNHGDSLRVSGDLSFQPNSPDGLIDTSVETITLLVGNPSEPVPYDLLPSGWTTKKGRLTWTSGKGSVPRVTFTMDPTRHTFELTATRWSFWTDSVSPLYLCLLTCNDDGEDLRAWTKLKKPGRYRLP